MIETENSISEHVNSLSEQSRPLSEQNSPKSEQTLEPIKQTPLMKQYWEIKNLHLDKILLYRMGDFYEMFYDDAVKASPILNITLTSRNKKSEDDTPMCGVPYHSIAGQINKLLNAGLKVAICDQLEDPEEAVGIVKRGVTRTLSPGMVYDTESLAENKSNFVAAFDNRSVSFLDASTGQCFYYLVTSEKEINELFGIYQPVEIILTNEQKKLLGIRIEGQKTLNNGLSELAALDTNYYTTQFDQCDEIWPDRFQNAPISAKRLLTYATQMQGTKILTALNSFEVRELKETMSLGANAIKHLELFKTYRGEEKGSLFAAIQRTKTSAGARLLKTWMSFPLVNLSKIQSRQNQIELWTKKPSDLKILRQSLVQMGDIERRLTKISYANVVVRDLLSLKQSLRIGISITPFCENINTLEEKVVREIVDRIEKTLVDDVQIQMKSGGYINRGIDAQLDELINLSENAQTLLMELEARERESSQINSLKIKYNSVFGYFIEVTNVHKDKVPSHYKRKQTLTNAERYVTEELYELETKILSSRGRKLQLEETLFKNLREYILAQGSIILNLAHKWSELDVISSLAWLALEQRYVRPQFSTDAQLRFEGSRHPVIEQSIKKTFVPNTVSLGAGECLLLTGPNMAGKSTLMRQVAITALLAQMGSFVPAASATLPIFQKLFTRIGASDSLAEGLSTFMVEMKETAEMLSEANEHTLVVLDEVGRGTSTYDGMSLAQSILEYLIVEKKCMTLFATHYHELTDLSARYKQVHNAHMSIQETNSNVDDQIQFLYTLKKGPANKSYGIHVARLAGLPNSILKRSQSLLEEHEKRMKCQLELF